MVLLYSLTQSDHAALSRSLRHLEPRVLVLPSAVMARSRASSIDILRKSDFWLGMRWLGLWLMKCLHGSG